MCCCVQIGGGFFVIVFCRQTINVNLSHLSAQFVLLLLLLSLAKDVLLMALLKGGTDLFSVFQCNVFNEHFWNVIFFFYFTFISHVTAMLFILATL